MSKTSSDESYLIVILASLIDRVKPYFLKRHECTKIVEFNFQIENSKMKYRISHSKELGLSDMYFLGSLSKSEYTMIFQCYQ